MIARLWDWLRVRAHQHAITAAQAAQPVLEPETAEAGVDVLEPPSEPAHPMAIEPALGAQGHDVATRMREVMTNIRLLTQLQFVDTLTVQAIDDEIVAIKGETAGNAAVLANLRAIKTLLGDALGYAGNMFRLKAIYDAAPEMDAAADYLLSLRPDPEQPPEGAGFLPITGGSMFGPLVLQADPRSPKEAATKSYADMIGGFAAERVLRVGDTMTGPLVLHDNPGALLEAVPKQYVDTLLSGVGYQGAWQVAANVPDLNPPAIAPFHGFRWLCLTVDPAVPELAPAGMPGIGGEPISNGSFIVWDEPLNHWHYVHAGGITVPEGNALYLQLTGALPMTGELTFANDGQGITLNGTARFYKRTGGGVVIRKSSGNQQPQIEENNGSAARDIIDTTNGDARYCNRAEAWQACTFLSGVGGRAEARKEQNGTVGHVRFWINRGGSNVGDGTDLFSVPQGFAPSNNDKVGFVGVNKEEGQCFYRLDLTRFVRIKSGGNSQDIYGAVTYRIA